ncbi:Ig-like domain-containing protein, partial [Photobacterium proteolyticum]|uniref:Ig-like domain-containing protein n=1 Tax=Photobacterium proteolyticum TaxID=1903952 RepID=UPI000AD12B4A
MQNLFYVGMRFFATLFFIFVSLPSMAGTLSNASITVSDTLPGVKATYTFTYTTETDLRVADKDQVFYVSFPSGFYIVDDPAVWELGTCQKLSVKVNGVEKTCANSNAWNGNRWITITEDVAAGSTIKVTLTGVTNSTTEGVHTFSFIGTSSSGGALVDDWSPLPRITIATPNSDPVISQGTSTAVTMSENGTPTAFSLTLTATDADADPLTWSINSQGSHGTASASGTGLSKAISYIPDTDYDGADSFVVEVSDGNSGTDTITVNVTIQNINKLPTAYAQTISLAEDTAKVITLSGTDSDGTIASYSVGAPSNGTLSGTAPNLNYT